MDSAEGSARETENLGMRIQMVNFAAIHTTSSVSLPFE
jgi:hypothetical protein